MSLGKACLAPSLPSAGPVWGCRPSRGGLFNSALSPHAVSGAAFLGPRPGNTEKSKAPISSPSVPIAQ